MKVMTLGYSPCPNDTHIFYALVHGRVDCRGLGFRERLEDVETLNRLALGGTLDVSKVSCHALGFIRDEYCVLRAGAALGNGCGPLVVSRDYTRISELKGKRVALPGRYTTASLLFSLSFPDFGEAVFMPFHMIMDAVRKGEVDAGVIIHESRFTYASYGLKMVMDLGEWWENETGRPIPLGCVVARRSLGDAVVSDLEKALRDSIVYASERPSEASGYIRGHSREMNDEVCAAHIGLYVNDYSLDLGREGESALNALLDRAESCGLIPKSSKKLIIK
jgi:1,4-dihydroxy-6-naphthoate synthase